jgi:hypothetical protein
VWLRLKDGRGWVQQELWGHPPEAKVSPGRWKRVRSEWPHYQLLCKGKVKVFHLRDEPEDDAESIHRFYHLDIIEVSNQAGDWLCVSDGSGWVLASHPGSGSKWVLLETDEWEVVPESPYFDKIKPMFHRRHHRQNPGASSGNPAL